MTEPQQDDRLASAVAVYREAVELYANLTHREMEFAASRPIIKIAAIRRLIGTRNEMTMKPHSVSSAEAEVESDAEYSDYLKSIRRTVYEKICAEGVAFAARCSMEAQFRLTGTPFKFSTRAEPTPDHQEPGTLEEMDDELSF